jgi:hypothetical protein
MTNPRTEAVAKAIWRNRWIEPEPEVLPPEKLGPAQADWERHKHFYMSDAQAAEKALMEALMEPSEAMIEAGARECVKRQGHGDPDSLYEGLPLWTCYVDEPKWSFPVMLKAAGEGQ